MTRSACLKAIYELAKKDERVVFIGSDLSPTAMLDFKRDFPDRFFMEGVNEQNCIGMAAGLAMEGYIPYVNTIASFLTRRCYEQVAMDVCAHNLPVRLIGNGGGLVYAPLGPTHTAIEDIAIMRALPNMTVVNCSDHEEMTRIMPNTLTHLSPIYIRLGKDSDPVPKLIWAEYDERAPVLLIGTGIMSHRLQWAARKLMAMNVNSVVLHLAQIKPLQGCEMVQWAKGRKLIVTAEEGIVNGGFGSAVMESLSDHGIHTPVLRLGIPDAFPHHYGEQEDLLETYGLTAEKIAKRVKEAYESLP